MTTSKTNDFPHAWLPVSDWELADVTALQAMERGDANADQQKRALAWIINKACLTYESTYSPVSAHDSSFAQGRRFTGLQIVKMLKLNAAAISRAKK